MECQRGLATRKVSLKRVKCNKRDMFYVLLEVTVQQSAVAALGVGCVLSNYSSQRVFVFGLYTSILQIPLTINMKCFQQLTTSVVQRGTHVDMATGHCATCEYAVIKKLRVTTMWVNRPLQVSQLGQLSLSSFRGR